MQQDTTSTGASRRAPCAARQAGAEPGRPCRAWTRLGWEQASAIGIGLLALIAPPLLAKLRTEPLVIPEGREIAIRLGLGVIVAALVGAAHWGRARLGRQRALALLALAASLSVAAWFNFGFFHGRTFIHYWDQFHYQLGSKYFPELGYDGLYVASIGGQADVTADGRVPEYARDLRSYEVKHLYELIPHMQEVWRRFTPERWDAFLADNRFFLESNGYGYIARFRHDHGYNATPTWTFVARLFDARLPTTRGLLTALALIDVALLVAMFTAVFWTFGARAGYLSLVLFGLGYAGRFSWMGGAFLRLDWLAASVIGICMLKRHRPLTAGALFGYAAMVRLFPVLFLFGPAVLAARALVRGERPRWAAQIALGFGAAVLLGLAAGSSTGRGPGAWIEFANAIRLHHETWLTNNVGLRNLLLYDRDVLERRDVDWSEPEPWIHVQEKLRRRQQERRAAIVGAQVAALLLLGASVWRASLHEAALRGMVAIFSLATLTCYYWILLLAVALNRRMGLVFSVLLLNLFMHVVHLLHPAFEMRYGMLSVGLALLFLAWVLPEAVGLLASRRQRTAVPVASAAGPSVSGYRGAADPRA